MKTDLEHAGRINDAMVDELTRDELGSRLGERLAADPTLGPALLGALRHARRELIDFALHVDIERSRSAPAAGEFDSQSTTLTDIPPPVAARRRTAKTTPRIDVPLMPTMVRELPDASVCADHGIEQRPDLRARERVPNDAWDAMTVTHMTSSRHGMPIAFAIVAALIAFAATVWYLAGSTSARPTKPIPAMPSHGELGP